MKRGFLGPSKKEPAGLCTIRKSTREVSIDTLQATAIEKVNQKSIGSNTTPSIDITCEKAKKVEVLILSLDKNGVLRDEDIRARNSVGKLIHTQGTAIPDDSTVVEKDDFDLKQIYITLMGQRPFHGFPCEQPMAHFFMIQELVSIIFNEIPENYHFCRFFPYTLAGEVACWFKKLAPDSLKTWKDIVNAFLNNYLYNAAANLEIEMESMLRYQVDDPTMEKRDEHRGSGEPSKVDEAGTRSLTSALIDSTTSTMTDGTTSTSTDGTTSTSTDGTTSTSIDSSTSTSTNGTNLNVDRRCRS